MDHEHRLLEYGMYRIRHQGGWVNLPPNKMIGLFNRRDQDEPLRRYGRQPSEIAKRQGLVQKVWEIPEGGSKRMPAEGVAGVLWRNYDD